MAPRADTLAFIVAKTLSRGMPPLFARKLSRSIYSEERGYRDDFTFDVSSQTGSRFVGTTKDQLAHGFSLVGYNEWRLWAVALALCREGDTIIEIGANIGTETVGFSDIVGARGKVVVFEPVPSTLESLRRSVSNFHSQNVEIMPCAVGDVNGQVSIRVPAKDHGEATLAHGVIDDGADLAVVCATLDSLSERLGRPRMLFIDAEGSEPVILAGGRNFIRRCTPDIVLEANPKCLTALGYSASSLLAELESLGYSVARLTRLGVDRELRTDFRGYENWLAVKDPRRFARVARLIRRCALLPCLWPLHPLRSPRRRW
jgi:FkbM family methyltransferase